MESKFYKVCDALLLLMDKVDKQGKIYPIDRTNWYKLLTLWKKLFQLSWWNQWKKEHPTWNKR